MPIFLQTPHSVNKSKGLTAHGKFYAEKKSKLDQQYCSLSSILENNGAEGYFLEGRPLCDLPSAHTACARSPSQLRLASIISNKGRTACSFFFSLCLLFSPHFTLLMMKTRVFIYPFQHSSWNDLFPKGHHSAVIFGRRGIATHWSVIFPHTWGGRISHSAQQHGHCLDSYLILHLLLTALATLGFSASCCHLEVSFPVPFHF